jgi:hypothetical protein
MKDRLEPWWFVYNTMFSTYIIDRVNINISTDHRLPASDNVTHDADLTPISAYMAWDKVRKRGGNMTLQFYVMPFVRERKKGQVEMRIHWDVNGSTSDFTSTTADLSDMNLPKFMDLTRPFMAGVKDLKPVSMTQDDTDTLAEYFYDLRLHNVTPKRKR